MIQKCFSTRLLMSTNRISSTPDSFSEDRWMKPSGCQLKRFSLLAVQDGEDRRPDVVSGDLIDAIKRIVCRTWINAFPVAIETGHLLHYGENRLVTVIGE